MCFYLGPANYTGHYSDFQVRVKNNHAVIIIIAIITIITVISVTIITCYNY